MILRFQMPLAEEAQIAFYGLISKAIGNIQTQVQTTNYAFDAHAQYFRVMFDEHTRPYDAVSFNTIDYIARDEATELWMQVNAPQGPGVQIVNDPVQHVNPTPEKP